MHCKHTSTAGEKQRDSDRSRADLLPHGSYRRCHGSWLGLLFWSPSLVCVSSLHPQSVGARAAVEFAGTDWQIHLMQVTQRPPDRCQWGAASHNSISELTTAHFGCHANLTHTHTHTAYFFIKIKGEVRETPKTCSHSTMSRSNFFHVKSDFITWAQ